MTYKYNINDLKLFGYHGVYDKEKNDGQFFLVNVEFDVDCDIDNLDDDISKIIDYTSICNDIAEVFNNRCDLLETLIANIKLSLENKYKGLVFSISIAKESYLLKHEVKTISVKNIK